MAGRHQVLHWRHNGRNNVIGQNRISVPAASAARGDRRTVPAVHLFARSQICSQLQKGRVAMDARDRAGGDPVRRVCA